VPGAGAGAGDAPLAWVGSSLAVPVESPPLQPDDDIRQIYAASPGQRIRLAPAGPPPGSRPAHVVLVDPATGEIRPTRLRGRPYHRLRGTPAGQVAACADEAAVAVACPGRDAECLISAAGRVHEFQWLTTPRASHLVLLTDDSRWTTTDRTRSSSWVRMNPDPRYERWRSRWSGLRS
jgi:hypothetical protein